MYIIKVLKRKDAASIIVAIWIAMSLNMLVTMPTYRIADSVSRIGENRTDIMYGGGGPGWRTEFLNPVVGFVIQIVIFEILIRLFVWAHPMFVRKAK